MKTVATRYALPLRALHWATVAVIAVVYLVAEFRGYLPREGGQRALAMQWHMFLGLFVLLLVLPRIGLRLVQPAPPILPPPARLLRYHPRAECADDLDRGAGGPVLAFHR